MHAVKKWVEKLYSGVKYVKDIEYVSQSKYCSDKLRYRTHFAGHLSACLIVKFQSQTGFPGGSYFAHH